MFALDIPSNPFEIKTSRRGSMCSTSNVTRSMRIKNAISEPNLKFDGILILY